MTTSPHPVPEQPRFATMADLEALEGRIINRISELELRIARDISAAFWRQLLVLLSVIIALVLGLAIPAINLGINILARLPATPGVT